ncbi:L-1,2-propanediol oxidoreductase [Escherichia coli]|nr:L-1,2-propanediol oxidoreductase [Escherichia coli]
MRSLEGLSPTNKASVPILAIPTTAGTAGEVSINYRITDEGQPGKFGCVYTDDFDTGADMSSEKMEWGRGRRQSS